MDTISNSDRIKNADEQIGVHLGGDSEVGLERICLCTNFYSRFFLLWLVNFELKGRFIV